MSEASKGRKAAPALKLSEASDGDGLAIGYRVLYSVEYTTDDFVKIGVG